MRFRGKGLGTQTGRLFAANVRGPANADGEPEWQTHPFPIDEEEDVAGFWTYLTRQEAEGFVRIESADPQRAAADRPPIQYPRARSRAVWPGARVLSGNAGDASVSSSRRRVARRYRACRSQTRWPRAWARRIIRPARPVWGRRGIARTVVGSDLKVHGFDNLRVADTSIYPDNVMHNTNLTALVVGEMAARLISGGNAAPAPLGGP